MKATTKVLSSATITAISTWTTVGLKVANAKTKAVDSLYADGVTADMVKAPPKGESSALFDSIKVSIVLGFTATVQTLLRKDTKTLNEAQKKIKREWQMQIGSKCKDLRNALLRREAAAGSDGAEEDKSTWESTKRKALADMISQAQKKEGSTIKDIASFIKDLQSALARIPATA